MGIYSGDHRNILRYVSYVTNNLRYLSYPLIVSKVAGKPPNESWRFSSVDFPTSHVVDMDCPTGEIIQTLAILTILIRFQCQIQINRNKMNKMKYGIYGIYGMKSSWNVSINL